MSNPVADITARILSQHSPNKFRPTPDQRKAKAAYWSYYMTSGEVFPTSVDAVSAARISGHNDVVQWWDTSEGFREWFSNGEEFRQKVEYAATTALDVLQEVISDPQSSTRDRLAAARMALEIAGKFPKGNKQEDSKSPLDEMTKEQLEQFIRSKTVTLLPE